MDDFSDIVHFWNHCSSYFLCENWFRQKTVSIDYQSTGLYINANIDV